MSDIPIAAAGGPRRSRTVLIAQENAFGLTRLVARTGRSEGELVDIALGLLFAEFSEPLIPPTTTGRASNLSKGRAEAPRPPSARKPEDDAA